MVDTLHIRGKEPVYGSVELSGDSLSAVFLSLSHLLDTDRLVLKNTPRSEMVLSFLEHLRKIGITVQWQNTSQVLLTVGTIQNDISFLSGEEDKHIALLLSAFIVGKRQSCILASTYRKYLKYYREFGFEFSFRERIIEIRVPDTLTIQKRLDMRNAEPQTIAFLLLLRKTFLNIELVTDIHNKRFDATRFEATSGMARIVSIPFDQEEFRLFATLGAISSSEVHIATFDLADSLEYLLLLEDCGVSYEVSHGMLKVWKDAFHFAHEYDLTHTPVDAVGYLLLLASTYSQKAVHFIAARSADLDEMVADMNMFGCKISAEETDEFSALTVRPNALGGQKTTLLSKACGGVQIVEAVLANGKTVLSASSELFHATPSLIENLQALHIDADRR